MNRDINARYAGHWIRDLGEGSSTPSLRTTMLDAKDTARTLDPKLSTP